jgi:hypothetical protein
MFAQYVLLARFLKTMAMFLDSLSIMHCTYDVSHVGTIITLSKDCASP